MSIKKLNSTPQNYPKTLEKLKMLKKHNDLRKDPFFWMNERDSKEVLEHLKLENDYVENKLLPVKKLREEIFEEVKAKIKEDDESVPVRYGDYFYYHKVKAGKEYPIFLRKHQSLQNKEEEILDANILAKGKNYFSTTAPSPSPNHQLIAYATDTEGRRVYTLYIKDLKTGRILHEVPKTTGNFVWANDGKTFFYTVQNETTLLWEKIYRSTLGSSEPSTLIYFEKDQKYSVSLSKSLSQRFIFIGTHSKLSSETYYLDADAPYEKPILFQKREANHEYSIEDGGDRFFIQTNWNAKNFRLMETPYGKTTKKYWKNTLPYQKTTLIENFIVFESYLALEERKNGLIQLRVYDRKKKSSYLIPMKDPIYMVDFGVHKEFKNTLLRYHYDSMTTPTSVYEFDLITKKTKLLKQKEILGDFQSKNYESKRIFAKAKDGTKIPISLVYKKGALKQKKIPLLIYGYGAYGISLDPSFSLNALSLLDRGFVFARAHVRGGSEMGREWYEKGRQFKKKNTFTDFIACTEFLIKKKLGTPGHLYAMGGSAGGLLMGAIVNMRPDLYKGVIAQVPFVDVLTTMLDESIPLTTIEYEEWGNPHQKKVYQYIKSYSPYDQIKKQNYPHILAITGYHDSQVQYWEPAKWIAKLRKYCKNHPMLLLRTEMEAGHGGKSGRFEYIHDSVALPYAFLLMLEEMV